MKLSGRHLKCYRQIARLLWKYGRGDLIRHIDAEDENLEIPSEECGKPEELAADLEEMGPAYVKLGQILSGRPDLLPEAWLKALERLQDNVKSFPFAEVEQIVTSELGVRMSKAFSEFDPEPIAAASLGQVHAASLRDGRKVVVKVQRPGIRQQITDDFEVLGEIAAFLDSHTETGRRYRFAAVMEEFRLTVQQELNYEREARNLRTLAANLREFPLLVVPQPIDDYSTRSVLTMERVQGRKITSVTPLVMMEAPGAPLAEELFKAYLKQVLVDGFFHADPHPGNVFLTDDGRLALLDLGMTGHTTPGMQESLLHLLMAISDGKSEEAADIVIQLSEKDEAFDGAEFRRRIGQIIALRREHSLKQLNVGRSLLEVSRASAQNGLAVPPELTLLGKTLLQLDVIGKVLHPDFDPNESIRRNVRYLMSQRVRKDLTEGSFFGTLLEVKRFFGALPSRMNRVMDTVSRSGIEVKVKSVDAKTVVEGMEKIANRVTTGLLLAALIVGAALLMRVETNFRLFGYPGLAIVCFLGAAAGGIWLVISVLIHDHKSRKKSGK
ncbi:MAG TPA: AarF/UbiB family protein [Verrucomicrobiales bacterium]|nr:AarF/UbiB family protein [Verrucomicrobiales bacterium]